MENCFKVPIEGRAYPIPTSEITGAFAGFVGNLWVASELIGTRSSADLHEVIREQVFKKNPGSKARAKKIIFAIDPSTRTQDGQSLVYICAYIF